MWLATRLIMATIVVHAGAGNALRDVRAQTDVCRAAVSAARSKLVSGGGALDAATAAVACLEDDPSTNAGVGACLNRAGFVELDALVMDGRDLRVGGVIAVRDVANPVLVARRLVDEADVNLLAGEGASAYARSANIAAIDPVRLVTARQRERLRDHLIGARADTVGAVVMDDDGHTATAVSTGGVPGKRPGRVGDTPLIGAGAWADDRSGVATTTGAGEAIMRVLLARLAIAGVESGLAPAAAAQDALQRLEQRVGGQAGVILVDPTGRPGIAFTTPQMCHALWVTGGEVRTGSDAPAIT